MYRYAWGNGPVNCATYQQKDIPNTKIYAADTVCESMLAVHMRVNRSTQPEYPDQDAWTWYCKYRDAVLQWGTSKVKGIAVDELRTNREDVPSLLARMVDVNYWCDTRPEGAIRRPDWVLALTSGNDLALDYILSRVNAAFPGKVWWFLETYIACYKANEGDYGLAAARKLIQAAVRNYVHSRSIYAFNHSHKVIDGQGATCDYFNAYGTPVTQSNPEITLRESAIASDAVSKGSPFGFGVWTPDYSSAVSREDIHTILSSVGCY